LPEWTLFFPKLQLISLINVLYHFFIKEAVIYPTYTADRFIIEVISADLEDNPAVCTLIPANLVINPADFTLIPADINHIPVKTIDNPAV
jgi:hypothetical protein